MTIVKERCVGLTPKWYSRPNLGNIMILILTKVLISLELYNFAKFIGAIVTNNRRRIAIIDDEPDIVTLFSEALIMNGYDTKGFHNPLVAIDYLNQNHEEFLLVITDWRMPSMTGFELCKLIFELDREIKTIITSAFELDQDQLKEIGKQEYLKKPLQIPQLIDAVNDCLQPKSDQANLM